MPIVFIWITISIFVSLFRLKDFKVLFAQTKIPGVNEGSYDYQFCTSFEYLKSKDVDAAIFVSGVYASQMQEEKIAIPPTYFEIRNFLEADLDIFITYCKGDIVQQILKYADYMSFYNLECYNARQVP